MAEGGDELWMSEEAINRALEAARSRVVHAERQRAELDRVIAAVREEQQLLERLLALRRGGALSDHVDGGLPPTQQLQTHGAHGDGRHPVARAVVEELEAAGRPLHISELMRVLRERGVAIPGSGTQANLITHLRRDAGLVRPSRGMYGLAAWGLQSMPAPHRARRRRKRMRSTASRQGRAEE